MIEESRTNLASQTQLARLLVMNSRQITAPQQLTESIGTVIKARVTLIAPNGAVIGDSDVGQAGLSQLENHLQRPEVQEALKNGSGTALRYSDTLRTSMLYSAMTYGGGTVDGIIRLAMPLEYLTSTRNTLHGLVGGAALVTILTALLFSYFLSNLTSKPLRDMADAAARIGHGGSNARIPVVSNDEIGMLATVLNDMSERIGDQVQHLSAEKQRLDTILCSMGEGVMVTAPEGVIILVNPAFRSLFSITGDIEGKRLVDISRHPDLLEAFELQTDVNRDFTATERHYPPDSLGSFECRWCQAGDCGSFPRYQRSENKTAVCCLHPDPVTIIKGYVDTARRFRCLIRACHPFHRNHLQPLGPPGQPG
jgi:two-component system phosphate regulon sensor histidine kinase PhoR